MNLGDKIRHIRINNKFTQSDFAESLYYSKQSISNWERNISTPPIDVIFLISNVYNVPLEYFFNFSSIKKNILEVSIGLLKNHIELNINNISHFGNIPLDVIKDTLKEKNLIIYIISEYDSYIEKEIQKSIKHYNNGIKFIIDKTIPILFYHKDVICHFYKNKNIAYMWESYIKNKYLNYYKNNFEKEDLDKMKLIISNTVEYIKIWLSNYINCNLEVVKKGLYILLNDKIQTYKFIF